MRLKKTDRTDQNGRTERNGRTLTPRQALLLAAPHTWAASACPALFGIAFCLLRGLGLGPVRAGLLLAACVCLQSAVNTLNDYEDFVKGTDSAADNVEASDAVLIYGNVRPAAARSLGLIYLAAGLALGLAASWEHRPAPLCIGAVGAAVVLLYSGGPLPLSYLPLGELASGVVMGGLIPLGVVACADGRVHWEVLGCSLPLILGIGLIMMSNNGCDIEKDLRAGRRTLPTLLGRERTLRLYRGITVLWAVLLAALSLVLTGWGGLVCLALLLAFGLKPFRTLLTLRLRPEERIRQMKGILAANIYGNGAFIAAVLVKAVVERFHV